MPKVTQWFLWIKMLQSKINDCKQHLPTLDLQNAGETFKSYCKFEVVKKKYGSKRDDKEKDLKRSHKKPKNGSVEIFNINKLSSMISKYLCH